VVCSQTPYVSKVLAGIGSLRLRESSGLRRPFGVVELHLVFIGLATCDEIAESLTTHVSVALRTPKAPLPVQKFFVGHQ
jgi:hypothetical protein